MELFKINLKLETWDSKSSQTKFRLQKSRSVVRLTVSTTFSFERRTSLALWRFVKIGQVLENQTTSHIDEYLEYWSEIFIFCHIVTSLKRCKAAMTANYLYKQFKYSLGSSRLKLIAVKISYLVWTLFGRPNLSFLGSSP